MISVIIPTWNDFDWLPECLESLGKQCVKKEIIIVDDGSTDKTERRLKKEVKDVPYIYHRIEHSGVSKATNEGFKISKGEYVMFADADMTFNNECLKKMLKTLEANPDCAFAYCNSVWTDVKGQTQPVVFDIIWNPKRLRENNYIDKCSLLRREVFEEFGGFDETFERLVDWDMWLTLVEKGHKGVHIPEVLYRKFLRPDGISARGREDYLKWLTKIQEKHNLCQMSPSLL